MDAQQDPPKTKERIVDWRALGRRGRKPTPWIAFAALGIIGFLLLEAYVWRGTPDDPYHEEERFRFEGVYMVERGTDGNFSTFGVSPWFSNPGPEEVRDLRFVVYAIENSRRIASSVGTTHIGDLDPKRTQNTTIDFRLNNTKNYSIEILVLEGDYLIARGYGSVGWVYLHDIDYTGEYPLRTMTSDEAQLTAGDFTYEYHR